MVKPVKITKTLSVYEGCQHRISGPNPRMREYTYGGRKYMGWLDGRPSVDGGIGWVDDAFGLLMHNGAKVGDEIEIIIRRKPKARKVKAKKNKRG